MTLLRELLNNRKERPMPRLIIETYQTKVEPDANPRSAFVMRPIVGEYERTGRTVYHNGGGHRSRRDWKKHTKRMNPSVEFDEQGRAKVNLGTQYGIHSYQLITFDESA